MILQHQNNQNAYDLIEEVDQRDLNLTILPGNFNEAEAVFIRQQPFANATVNHENDDEVIQIQAATNRGNIVQVPNPQRAINANNITQYSVCLIFILYCLCVIFYGNHFFVFIDISNIN